MNEKRSKMKIYLKIILLYLLCPHDAVAQKAHKHSVAIGTDYVAYTYPLRWNSAKIVKQNQNPNSYELTRFAFWINYYYRNQYAVRVYTNYFLQRAQYKVPQQTPNDFLSSREAEFYDLVIGYNFSPLLINKLHQTFLTPVDIWLYGGASYVGNHANVMYSFYNPIAVNWGTGGYGAVEIDHRDLYYNKVRPTIHLQIKYNPIRFVLLAIGGTYHFVGKDFKPVSGNVSLGFQL
jgi:hypothetical protein